VSKNNNNIPLDEMITDLKQGAYQKKSRNVEDGELVTRADGSKAIRKKSRKRRTDQPKKEIEKKNTKRKILLIVSAIGLLVLLAITYTFLLGYYNGNRFKSKLNDTLTSVSGADVELGKLDVNPSSAKLSKIGLQWSSSESLLKSLNLDRITAQYGILGFAGVRWSGDTVTIGKGELKLEMGSNSPKLVRSSDKPLDIDFNVYQCLDLSVDFGDDSLWKFDKGSINYRVSEELESQLSIDDGDLVVPNFGEFEVRSGLLSFSDEHTDIYLSLEQTGHSGIISVDGTVGYTEGSKIDLKTKLQKYPLGEWIDPRARRFIQGQISSGEGSFEMIVGEVNSYKTKTEASSKLIEIKGFEFINTLAQILVDDDYYSNPRFISKSSLAINRTNNRIEFSDVDLVQDGQMKIQGNFIIDDANLLSGNLRIGIPIMLLSEKEANSLKAVFKENGDEYIWTEVNLGGDVTQPRDDLDEQFKAAEIRSGDNVPLFEHQFEELSR
jgi:hypothetical protein